ncbi:glycosyltransferase family 2 protein [Aquipseudomonas alcaligenes]|uniref:glycosyltransferase family 2 protein n=1 Tax=Aquipseudomonas alcaligenes TaxID=43263 RepID=UPI003747A27D
MKIDVVIPAYNAGAFIIQALESVAQQTLPPVSIIVVDDGSLDDTAELVRRFADAHPTQKILLVSQPNKGISGARNAGLKVATSEFVALLDADDLWKPEKLERQAALFMREGAEKLGIVYCDYQLIDEKGSMLQTRHHVSPRLRGRVRQELRKSNRISGSASAVLIRSSVLNDVGLFDEALVCCEDWDLWLRISQGWEFDYAPQTLVCIRRHSQSIQLDNRKMLEGDLRIALKLSDEGSLSTRLWLSLLGRMRFLSIQLADFSNCRPGEQATRLRFSPPMVLSLGSLVMTARHLRKFVDDCLRRWGLREY